MAKNSLGRDIPETWRGRALDPYQDPWSRKPEALLRATRPLVRRPPRESKLLPTLRAAIERCGLKDGMTVSTHHALRNGDLLLNLLVRELDAMGFRDMGLASSSVHGVNAEIIPYIRKGVVTRIETGVNGLIGELASKGELDCPIVVRSHGGRARSLVTGEVEVDATFIAAPSCDLTGNLNGVNGPAACGSLGYAHTDARYAKKVVAVTDHLVPFPCAPISISQSDVDYVVEIESLGDPKKIVSTTTRITRDPAGLLVAKYATEVIDASGLLKDGFSFQTGSGGTSLAVASLVQQKMAAAGVKGSFGCGGITGYFVDMLEQGLFDTLFDVQCFDLRAVESLRHNPGHREISADLYANPYNRGTVVNMLDCVILGATEVDVDFNVNVNTESSGYLLHNTGGHCDTAAGAKLAIVVAPSMRGRLPIVRERVTTVTTPGETVDVIVTERGICVAPRHGDLARELRRRNLPVKEIHDFHEEITRITGVPRPVAFGDEVVALIEYRDGSIIDVVRRVRE
jgi:citrate lyase subunit alpha/citrate CoA-transferase